MAYEDGTGPMGLGPLTGRGLGLCAQTGTGLALRRGRDFGRGFRRGFRWRQLPVKPNFPAQPTPKAEPVELSKEEQKKILEAELAEIEAEKKEIEKTLKALK